MKWDSRLMAGRAASVATIWGISKLLATARGKRATKKLDQKVNKVQRETSRSVSRKVRNARDNRGLLAAGFAALAIGAALLGRAAGDR